ncbi:2,3-diaminopropionate biosynthesis protein SbnB [Cohnella suwonensis]|uniref:2,3-diaminopropionate biosynthesis protein SbnB n=1 Tax=Cohnella suwonensis TaxID=696072 RepID=A0ABW0LR20_9BACL
MYYLNDGHIRAIGSDWHTLRGLVEQTLRLTGTPEVVQPLKPYLRYGDPGNRIIAMPAYVGGDTAVSGMKWIASFPGNLAIDKPRAHGAIILNEPNTGVPVAVINGALVSQLRTAAVSAAMLRAYMDLGRRDRYRVGLVGWGPIGRRQFEMLTALHGDRIDEIRLHDRRGIDPSTIDPAWRDRTIVADDWREAYQAADIVVTCTAATDRYIDEAPSPGALLLNVSLRDYKADSVKNVRTVVVDDWREVCRENTDVELLHRETGLSEGDVLTLREVVWDEALKGRAEADPVFFNPMGMAAFDMAVAAHYWREGQRLGIGAWLED